MNYLKKVFCTVLALVTVFTMLSVFAKAEEEEWPDNASYVSGDADGNAIVNSADALAILNHVIGEIEITDIVRRTAADVNNDNILNSTDALMILNFKVGNIDGFIRENYNLKKIAGNMTVDGYTGCVVDAKGAGLLGFAYDMKSGVFYATGEAWQREFGYNEMYDYVAVVGTMPLDTIRIKFEYDNKQWMVQLWKGFYGLVLAGCEVGFYNRPIDTDSELSAYNVVSLDYYQDIKCDFYYKKNKGAKPTFSRESNTWWLTGFTPSINYAPQTNIPNMRVEVTIKFTNKGLYEAFIGGLKGVTSIFSNYTGKNKPFYFTENQNFQRKDDLTVWFEWQ